MPIRELKDEIARLPEQPGVYLYFSAAGETIYVGKARSLRSRVRNYLGAYGSSPRTDALLDEIARLEVIITDSVVEALALENNLIKQRSPKFNILLRDDKNYPYLQLDDQRGLSARAGRAPGRARRQLLRGSLPACPLCAQDHGPDPPAVRHPVVQRGDHGEAGAAVPRVRHQTLPRALRGHRVPAGGVRPRGRAHRALPRGEERGPDEDAACAGCSKPRPASGSRRRRRCATR